jgi:hypothetical protein
MRLVSNGFNILNVNDLIHLYMLIIEKMFKKFNQLNALFK